MSECSSNITPPESSSTDSPDTMDFELIPKKRGKKGKYTSIMIFMIAAFFVIVFCLIDREEDVYYIDKSQKNTTDYCYRKEKRLMLSGIFTTALGLFGVVLGTLFNRLSLLTEEQSHILERYEGNCCEMVKACFSVIKWGPVLVLLLLTSLIFVIIILATDRPFFETKNLIHLFSGIGVGPLITHLLNLNTESKVYISTLVEEKGLYVANELASAYYFNYLKQALPKFEEIVNGSEQETKLSLKKLLLLITLNCHMNDDLSRLDNKIEKLPDITKDNYRFHVYRLTVNREEQKIFAIQYVEIPLNTLRYMKLLNGIEAVKRTTCAEEVKLLYRTLSEILADPVSQQMCLLVPIAEKEGLQNGGLVKCIMGVVNHSGCVPGFVRLKNVRQSNKANSRSVTNNDENQNVRHKKGEKEKKRKKLTKSDSSDTCNSRENEQQRLVKCDEEGYDSGATTSGIESYMLGNRKRSQQNDQQGEHSSNNRVKETRL